MTTRSLGMGIGAWMIASALFVGAPRAADEASPRERLDLDPTQGEALKATMREHLAALESIVAELARQDYEKAADLARSELGFRKHHEAMRREQGAALPKEYLDLAMEHHQAAEDLAEAIDGKEMTAILQRLAGTIRACTACHRAYRM